MIRRYPREEAAPIQAGSTEDWSREAWQISRDVTYRSALGGDVCATAVPARVRLDDRTINDLIPVQRRQIERAGLRLARLLDEALG